MRLSAVRALQNGSAAAADATLHTVGEAVIADIGFVVPAALALLTFGAGDSDPYP
jgi:hypothetical protein